MSGFEWFLLVAVVIASAGGFGSGAGAYLLAVLPAVAGFGWPGSRR